MLEDQAFLYTLEELSGEDYAIQQDALGGFKVSKRLSSSLTCTDTIDGDGSK